jgi:hypothetical protein
MYGYIGFHPGGGNSESRDRAHSNAAEEVAVLAGFKLAAANMQALHASNPSAGEGNTGYRLLIDATVGPGGGGLLAHARGPGGRTVRAQSRTVRGLFALAQPRRTVRARQCEARAARSRTPQPPDLKA